LSNITPTGTEILYQMPAVGATLASTTATVVSGNAAGNPAYQMPALASIWQPHQMQGKGIQILAGGTYDATAVGNTMALRYDPTQGTAGTLIAGTGSAVVISGTTMSWTMEILLTCTQVGNNTSNWMTSGALVYGISNNAATVAATTYMVGGAQAAGVPAALALATEATIGYIELWSTWATAPTAFVCSQFLIQGLN
jgi:hypothetical protein